LPGRGLVSVATLIGIALTCVAVSRRFERERRLLGKLRARGAIDSSNEVPLGELSDDERDAAESLATAGVLRIRQNRCYIRAVELVAFRRKRLRLLVSGACGALLLCCLVALMILRH
jgi:hypothetical protein